MYAGNKYYPSAPLLQKETTSTDIGTIPQTMSTDVGTIPQNGGYSAVVACPPYVQYETKCTDYPSAPLLQKETTSTDIGTIPQTMSTDVGTIPQNGGYSAVVACPPYVQYETKCTGLTRDTIWPIHNGGYAAVGGAQDHGIVQPMYPQREYHIDSEHTVVNQPGRTRTVNDVKYRNAPTDYTIASVCACICCFWPMALCAIYYASQAKSLAAKGDFVEATKMSNNARNLMIGSIVIGIILIPLFIYLQMNGSFQFASQHH